VGSDWTSALSHYQHPWSTCSKTMYPEPPDPLPLAPKSHMPAPELHQCMHSHYSCHHVQSHSHTHSNPKNTYINANSTSTTQAFHQTPYWHYTDTIRFICFPCEIGCLGKKNSCQTRFLFITIWEFDFEFEVSPFGFDLIGRCRFIWDSSETQNFFWAFQFDCALFPKLIIMMSK